MVNIILLVLVVAVSLAVFIWAVIAVHKTRGSLPVKLSQANYEKPAKGVDLGPYVGPVSSQFSETLDM